MSPIRHALCNGTLGSPVGSPHIPKVHVHRYDFEGVPITASYWKPNAIELEELAAGGCIALHVMGATHAPISVRTEPATIRDFESLGTERGLREQLADLHREYRERAEPIIKQLVRIESVKTPEFVVVLNVAATMPFTGSMTNAEVDEMCLDATRLRWLTEDHASRVVRDRRDEILRRMPVMSHSAATSAIDVAIEETFNERMQRSDLVLLKNGRSVDLGGRWTLPT